MATHDYVPPEGDVPLDAVELALVGYVGRDPFAPRAGGTRAWVAGMMGEIGLPTNFE